MPLVVALVFVLDVEVVVLFTEVPNNVVIGVAVLAEERKKKNHTPKMIRKNVITPIAIHMYVF